MTLSTSLNEILVYSFGGKILEGFGDEYIEVDICPINYSAVLLVLCVVNNFPSDLLSRLCLKRLMLLVIPQHLSN